MFSDAGTASNQVSILIALLVLSLLLLGVAILVIIDHKAKIPGSSQNDLFSIAGVREEHPIYSFLALFLMFPVILMLLIGLATSMGEKISAMLDEGSSHSKPNLADKPYAMTNRHFHIEPEQDLVNHGKKTVCFYCHGDYPHAKEPTIRSMLNMHTQFIACMTCHNDPQEINEGNLSFGWLNYSGIEVDGPPFGTDVDSKTGKFVNTDDIHSKIVVYRNTGGKRKLIEILETDKQAQQFIDIKDNLSSPERELFENKFHEMVVNKGSACEHCHMKESDSYLPYRKLQFSQKRISEITNLDIIGISDKHKKFFIPTLYNNSAL